MNFRVVENAPPAYLEKYDEFIELYNNRDNSIEDIKRILGWNVKQLGLARSKALKEGRVTERRKVHRERPVKKERIVKHYSLDCDNKFRILKYLNGEYIYYGRYDDEDTVKKIVCELKKVDWDKRYLDSIKVKVLE